MRRTALSARILRRAAAKLAFRASRSSAIAASSRFAVSATSMRMGAAARGIYQLLVLRNISSYLATVAGIFSGVVVYGVLMIVFKELDSNMARQILGRR